MDEKVFRPYRYCFRTWKDGIPAYRHELAETWECWNEMNELRGVDRPQQQQHFIMPKVKRAYDLFRHRSDDENRFCEFVELRDGWMGHMRRRKKKYHDKLFHGPLQTVLDGADDSEETIKDKETFRAFWPF